VAGRGLSHGLEGGPSFVRGSCFLRRIPSQNVVMRARRNRRVVRPAIAAKPAGRSTWDMLLWNHTKLWAATLVGLIVAVALPSRWLVISRMLTGWNAAMFLLVSLTYIRMRRLDARQLRDFYEEEDPTAPVIVVFVIAAALLSVAAIVAPAERVAHLLLATMTIVYSWLVVHTMFTLHYADLYYSVAEGEPPPLAFPETRQPLFWDFVYFSFTIGVACQTADVVTTQTGIRRKVTVHAIIAFVFNLLILGFAINVSAGLLGNN
jgi:uncharacterized membrane protein